MKFIISVITKIIVVLLVGFVFNYFLDNVPLSFILAYINSNLVDVKASVRMHKGPLDE